MCYVGKIDRVGQSRCCWPCPTGCLGSSTSSSNRNDNGNGGNGGNDTALSGTVAAGAPLFEFVAAKDSEDNVVSAEVDGDSS